MLIDAIKRRWIERSHYSSIGGWILSLYSRFLRRNSWPLPFRGATRSLRLKGISSPFYFRLGTTDLLVLEEIFFRGEYDCVLQGKLGPIRCILDLGANVGYSLRYWKQHFPVAKIIAVEPDPENAKLCLQNCEAGGFSSDVKIIQGCVGASCRQAALNKSGVDEWAYSITEAAGTDARPVEVYSLMEVLKQGAFSGSIDLLKCDIEGSEKELFAECGEWIGLISNLVVELHKPYTEALFIQAIQRPDAQLKVITRTKLDDCPVLFLVNSTKQNLTDREIAEQPGTKPSSQ